jgi:hypothetical protein
MPEGRGLSGGRDLEMWQGVPWFGPFVDLVTGEGPWFETKSALLWDDDFLYIAFELEEPNVQARLTTQDAQIFAENDVEVFIAGENAYYELELNAQNTIYEVLWVWRDALDPGGVHYGRPELELAGARTIRLFGIGGHRHPRGERVGYLDWDLEGLVHSVEVRGTLNDTSDEDLGWRVELAIPWQSLGVLAEGRPLPPSPGDTWRIECSRFQWTTREGTRLAEAEGWTWSAHGYYDSHMPESFPHIEFSALSAEGDPRECKEGG